MSIAQAPPNTLAGAQPGFYRCIEVIASGQNAVRLKRLGICVSRMVELVGPGDPMVVKIGESRIGVSRQLAEQVAVEAVRKDS